MKRNFRMANNEKDGINSATSALPVAMRSM